MDDISGKVCGRCYKCPSSCIVGVISDVPQQGKHSDDVTSVIEHHYYLTECAVSDKLIRLHLILKEKL